MQSQTIRSIAVVLMGITIVTVAACSQINKKLGLPDDNLGEELIEAAIKIETGLDIDLTPDSVEI